MRLSGILPDVSCITNSNLDSHSLAEGLLLDQRGMQDDTLSFCSDSTKKGFASTTYSPGPSTICRSSVNCTLINEDKLGVFVSSNACHIHSVFVHCVQLRFERAGGTRCRQKHNINQTNTHLLYWITTAYKCPPYCWKTYGHTTFRLQLLTQFIEVEIRCVFQSCMEPLLIEVVVDNNGEKRSDTYLNIIIAQCFVQLWGS